MQEDYMHTQGSIVVCAPGTYVPCWGGPCNAPHTSTSRMQTHSHTGDWSTVVTLCAAVPQQPASHGQLQYVASTLPPWNAATHHSSQIRRPHRFGECTTGQNHASCSHSLPLTILMCVCMHTHTNGRQSLRLHSIHLMHTKDNMHNSNVCMCASHCMWVTIQTYKICSQSTTALR